MTRSTATARAREGRCLVEGILEGPLPPVPGFVEFLEAWRTGLAEAGLPLRVSVDGGRFDVHAPGLEVEAPEVGRDPVDVLEESLRALVEKVPDGERARLHSTLRATVFGHGTQRRTLFALRDPGVLERVEDRALAATLPPVRRDPSSLPRRWAFWVTLVLATLVLVVFGPSPTIWDWSAERPVDPRAVGLEAAAGPLELTGLDREPGARGAWFALVRRGAPAPTPAPDDAAAWLAWLGEARGRAVLEWRDGEGRLLRLDPVDLTGLPRGEEHRLALEPPPAGAASLRLSW